jgi:hypothetical protein
MTASNRTQDKATHSSTVVSWFWLDHSDVISNSTPSHATPIQAPTQTSFDILRPVRRWLDQLDVQDSRLAHVICKSIPAQCPFERDIQLFGRTVLHIPPMCKLNPLYEEVVGLRFRALCYLADKCGEDISSYC